MIDANAAYHVKNSTPEGGPVLEWLLNPKKKAAILIGGKLTEELVKAGLADTLTVLDRAGRVKRVAGNLIDPRVKELKKSKKCVSNDHHVVAIASVSSCPLIFSSDKALHQDLRNIVGSKRKISIYQDESHKDLLKECNCRI